MFTGKAKTRHEKYAFVSDTTVRRVWAEVSRTPCVPTRQIAQRVGKASSTVHIALLALRDAGYIDFESRAAGARQILIPFVVTGEVRNI